MGPQEMARKSLNEKMSKRAMIQAQKILPDLDVFFYNSTGEFQGRIPFDNYYADYAKKTKLSNEVNVFLKDCKEETKFDAWLGEKPGKGKKLKFGENGLTGKSSILKLFCAAFGGASKLEKLVNEHDKEAKAIRSDLDNKKINLDEAMIKFEAILYETTTICIQVVE